MSRSRLLSVNNYYYRRGGAETLFMGHNSMFEERGWNVRSFCMKHPLNEAGEYQESFVDEIEYGADYGILKKLSSGAKAIYSFEAKRNIGRLIDAFEPDICHAHNIYHHLSTSILHELKKRRIPTVLTLHDFKIACPAYTMLRDGHPCELCRDGVHNVLAKRCIKQSFALSSVVYIEALLTRYFDTYHRCVDRFISPSRFLIDKFAEWGIDTSRITHVPNFVYIKDGALHRERQNTYLFIGRLAKEKGLGTLVDAFAASGRHLWIAGDGPMRAELEKKVAGHDNIELLGRLSGDEVSSALQTCKASLVPSENYENCPMSVLESLAQGTPVLASASGGLAEMVIDGENGCLFAPGSPAALNDAVDRFESLSDSGRAALMDGARETATIRYSPENYRRSMESIYAEFL